MARGESTAKHGGGPGLAIFAAFGVLCLAATLLVLWTTQDCSGLFRGPVAAASPEPFPGANAALTPLGGRECASAGGPSVASPPAAAAGGAPSRSLVEGVLEGRGYVATQAGWSAPAPLPLGATAPSMEGSCGIVAVVVDPGGSLDRVRSGDGDWRSPGCTDARALLVACEGDDWAVEGTGSATIRSFAMPGLDATTARQIGVPADVLLAHAEAEAHLRSIGWEPGDDIVVQDVPPSSGTATSQGPPSAPSSGCIGWVAVGRGLGAATTRWDHHVVDTDPSPEGFTSGLVSCAPDPSLLDSETRVDLTDLDGSGGRIWFRPFAPASGPAVSAGAGQATTTIARARAAPAPPSTLPAPVPMQPR